MFSELNRTDILEAIKSKVQNPIRQGADYSVLYYGEKYSPRELITRAYQLSRRTNPSPGFNTNQAQKRLLELGFPIVENTKSQTADFFSEKDLVTFDMLVQRKSYNKTSPIDNNIGTYLNTISWGKSQFWAEKLKGESFDLDGKRTWNKTHRVHGQIYQKYSWFRLIPKSSKNRGVYFTVGIDWHSTLRLIYKLDIQRNDSYFDDARQEYFDRRLSELNINRHYITKDEIHNYSWDRLIKESQKFMLDNLDNYNQIVEGLRNIKPIKAARICWNTNGWTSPSGPFGKSPFGSFESVAGFANDEWLFDLNSNDGGFTYARLEPIQKSRKKLAGKKIDLLLFTFERDSENMIWIGKISNVIIVNETESQLIHFSPVGISWYEFRISQLKAIQGVNPTYYEKFAPKDMYNLKFRPDDVHIFDFSSAVDDEAIKVKRYILHNISLQQAMNIIPEIDDFEPKQDVDENAEHPNSTSLPSTPKKIKKTFNSFTREYENVHKEIQRGIVQYLRGKYPKASVSFENNKEINNGFIDIVVLNEGLRTYIEIKSYPSLRACIRAALGQLIEYSFFVDTNKADRLVISSQHPCTTEIDKFLSHLRTTINLNIYYAQFDSERKQLVGLDFL
jgi:hypothetical protein